MRRALPTGILAVVVVTAVAFAANRQLAAQNQGPQLRVACLDVVRVFNEYQRQKDLEAEMKDERDRLELESAQRKQKIDAANAVVDALDPQDPAYRAKMRELLELNVSYRAWMEVTQAAMAREVGVWTAAVYKEILDSVEQVADERGCDLVLYRDAFEVISTDPAEVREQIRNRKLIYANDGVDLSQSVLDRLNAQYRSQPPKKMINIW